MRNPIIKKEELPVPEPPAEAQNIQIVEREINLSLINDKLNYITGLLHKIVEAAEIDLTK